MKYQPTVEELEWSIRNARRILTSYFGKATQFEINVFIFKQKEKLYRLTGNKQALNRLEEDKINYFGWES